MRVLAPISVSIFAFLFLLGFRLNICVTLGAGFAARLGLDRHALRLPHERLPEPVAASSLPL